MALRKVMVTNWLPNVYDGRFKINKISYDFERVDGGTGHHENYEIFERGDAVSVLIYNRDSDKVILVHQIRAPLVRKKPDSNGWLIETMAGMPRAGEAPEAAARREAEEETGCRIAALDKIGSFYSSPGGSSELIWLYFAAIGEADRVGPGGGKASEGEHIELIEVCASEFLQKLDAGEYLDPKLIVSGYWFTRWYADLKNGAAKKLVDGQEHRYRHAKKPETIVAIRTGDIAAVRDIEYWVNSENTMMMMDRFDGKTISASIRYLAAAKSGSDDKVVDDLMQSALNHVKGERHSVEIGEVLVTESYELAKRGVEKVLHLATVIPDRDRKKFVTTLDDLRRCVGNVLTEANRQSSSLLGRVSRKLRVSREPGVLLPVIGTGDGGQPKEQVIPMIVEVIGTFLTKNSVHLGSIHILAYSRGDLDLLRQAFETGGRWQADTPRA